MAKKRNKSEAMTRAIGGQYVEVTYLPGDSAAKQQEKTETVLVRKLSLTLMPQYLMAVYDDARTIELFCEKDPGWAESLTDESKIAVLTKGQEINLPLFEAWYPVYLEKARVLRPGFIKDLEEQVKKAIAAQTNGANAPGLTNSSPSSASGPATAGRS